MSAGRRVAHRLRGWLDADTRASDDRAWTANLAIFRVVFVGWIALPAARGALGWIEHILPGLPAEAWRPISFFQLLPMSVLTDVSLARALAKLNIALLILGLAGIRTRLSLGLAALVSTYVLGLSQNQFKVTQNCHIVWFLALLAAGPSGNMLSVDGIVRALRGAGRENPDPPVASPNALLTLRFVWLLFGLIFLMPGLAKLHAALVDGWAGADHVRGIFWRQWLTLSQYQPGRPPPAAAIAALPSWLLELGAWLVIAFEIGFVAIVLFRPLRPVAIAGGLLFHAFTERAMHIRFAMLVPAYVGLVDWVALVGAVRRRLGIPRLRLAARYDSPARRRIVAVLRSLDVLDLLEPPLASDRSTAMTRAERTRVPWVKVVGFTLVGAQVLVSGMRVVALRSERAGVAREASSAWSRWRWPFDAYPDFARRRIELDIWEVRVALPDGREVPLDPRAYWHTYGAAAKTLWLFEFALAEVDAERRRSSVLPLVRAVVERADAATRAAATEARLYTIRYRIAGRAPTRLAEHLEYQVPLDGDRAFRQGH